MQLLTFLRRIKLQRNYIQHHKFQQNIFEHMNPSYNLAFCFPNTYYNIVLPSMTLFLSSFHCKFSCASLIRTTLVTYLLYNNPSDDHPNVKLVSPNKYKWNGLSYSIVEGVSSLITNISYLHTIRSVITQAPVMYIPIFSIMCKSINDLSLGQTMEVVCNFFPFVPFNWKSYVTCPRTFMFKAVE